MLHNNAERLESQEKLRETKKEHNSLPERTRLHTPTLTLIDTAALQLLFIASASFDELLQPLLLEMITNQLLIHSPG